MHLLSLAPRRSLLILAFVATGCGKPAARGKPATDIATGAHAEESREAKPLGLDGLPPSSDTKSYPPNIENSLGMKFVLIPAGEFQMGAPDADADGSEDERPQHLVRIGEQFYIAIYEVTHAEYELLMKRNPSTFAPDGQFASRVAGEDDRRFPVMGVTWDDAVEFCRLLSGLPEERAAGRHYRLPTEAEWEYACRGGAKTAYSWGNTIAPENAVFDHTALGAPFLGRPKSVGSYAPNAFGLYDMHGNAEEWCQDYFAFDYYARSPAQNPINLDRGQLGARVLRGGYYNSHPLVLRSSRREFAGPQSRINNGGIRLVLSAP